MTHSRLKYCLLATVLVLIFFLPHLLGGANSLDGPDWIGLVKEESSVYLSWFRVQGAVRYIVQRKIGEGGEFQKLAEVVNPVYYDFSISPDKVYFYRIIPVDRSGVYGRESEIRFISIPPIIPQTISAPRWVSSLVTKDGIALSWSHENHTAILAYNLYRKKEGDNTFTLITSSLGSTYLDRDVIQGMTNQYVVTALDKRLKESDRSEAMSVEFFDIVLPEVADEYLASINTLEEVIKKTELVKMFSWEEYGFVSPVDVDYNRLENLLYVSDSATGKITIIRNDGEILFHLGGTGKNPWEFERLLGIDVLPNGDIYALDGYKGEIVKFSGRWTFEKRIRLKEMVLGYFGADLFNEYPGFRFGTVDINVTSDGSKFVVDNPNGWVYVLDANDTLVRVIGEKGYQPGKMQYPTFSTLDRRERILVADTLNGRIQVFDINGQHFGIIGGRGIGIGQFLRPKGLVFDETGNLYIADSQQNIIQVYDRDMQFMAVLGDERGFPIDIGSPNGLAYIEPGQIVICERLSRRIQIRRVL